jgi:hypothetical protein
MLSSMTKKTPAKPKPKARTYFMAFRPTADLALAMAKLEKRDGINTSTQIRRALTLFLKTKGILVKEAE